MSVTTSSNDPKIAGGARTQEEGMTTASVGRAHGTRAKYVHEQCRCQECRRATAEYEKRGVRRNAYGLSPWVDAEPVRRHVRSLMSSGPGRNDGVSWKRIAEAAGVEESTVSRLLYGRGTSRTRAKGDREYRAPSRRLHKDSAERLLALKTIPLAGGALTSARPTWHMIDELTGFGITRARIARTIGQQDGRLQLSTNKVTVANARDVEELHWTVFQASGEFRRYCSCPIPASVGKWLEGAESRAGRLRQAGVA